mgnify:CR=1 FL=1
MFFVFSADLGQFAERGTFFSHRLYCLFPLESVTKSKVKINQKQQTLVAYHSAVGAAYIYRTQPLYLLWVQA